MASPFSIMAPEEVAKDYGGNKQKIAQAAQMGIIDPTAAVLAGMFIDRMRSAQVMEAAQQPTVAQQVLGGGGAAPSPVNVTPGAGGSPVAPPPPPMMGGQMGPAAPPMEAPMGMAAGGLAALPVPDAMFDEPDNGGYAGGGLVAFSDGGMADLYDEVEYVESRGNQNAVSPKGARGVMQLMPGTMRDPGFGISPMRDNSEAENRRVGQQYLEAMNKRYGDRKLALMAYNWGPGNVDKWLKAGAPADRVPKETRDYVSKILGGKSTIVASGTPDRELTSASGRALSIDDAIKMGKELNAPTQAYEEANARLRERLAELGSDEHYEEQRKASMWETLAQIGFNMASSKSPYILQAVSEAAAAAMPGAMADKKERKQLKDRALQGLRELAEGDMRLANEGLKLGVDLWKAGFQQEQFEKELAQRERRLDIQEMQVLDASADRKAQIENARDPFDRLYDAIFEDVKKTYPNMSDADARFFAAQKAQGIVEKTKQQYRNSDEPDMSLMGQQGSSGSGKVVNLGMME